MNLAEALQKIKPVSAAAARECAERFNRVAKPVGSLGKLEDLLIRIAAASGSAEMETLRKAVAVFCADNGVTRRGVALHGQAVTAAVAEVLGKGGASVSVMAKCCGAEVLAIDVGMADTVSGLRDKKLMPGTDDMTQRPAMSRETAEQALTVGIETVGELKERGFNLIATGEVGIGNTTTSSAICAVLLNRPVKEVTGRGAGLDDAGLSRKISAIETALTINKPDPNDPMDVLRKVGGLDIAALAGVFIGGALHGVPVVADGFISCTAALIARRLCPPVTGYIIPSHVSEEPAAQWLLEEFNFSPVIHGGMRLGEGTGAVALFPLLDMALAVYRDAATYDDIGVKQAP
ncbi:MAG: nicotinate-nucleotide--dimethylbenzimidazole phosphoribosyltransferase [Clostridiales bacterium]|jgi:nicotinate-nucleotide--dimethylbenzimidazole phosphoribosyltransferase|nr:nicotinate-nucleotide--dimethylbenzimidazole phosphoribosyltransferase [Clostridiales bacterium]